jgi:hypothetical protein
MSLASKVLLSGAVAVAVGLILSTAAWSLIPGNQDVIFTLGLVLFVGGLLSLLLGIALQKIVKGGKSDRKP